MKKNLCSLFLALAMILGVLPTAAFAAENEAAPFTAAAGETALTVTKSEEDYTYTVVTEYDENWNPMTTEEQSTTLYVATVPAGSESVTLDFGAEECIAYTYDADGNYVGACGEYGDGTSGKTTAAVSGDLSVYVRVQTPYDESWNSEFLYAVAFDVQQEEELPDEPNRPAVSVEALLTNISAGYTDSSGEWYILDMAAYAATTPNAQSKTSDDAKQAYIDAVIASVSGENVGEAAYAKAILTLQSIGADPRELYPEGSDTAISAVNGLKALTSHSSSAWVAPYTLASLNQGDYGTEELEQSIIAAVLAGQKEDGSWSEWGDSIQTTANMIAGLAFYYGSDDTVTAAVDQAVSFLASAQKEDGSFDAYGSGADANTAAMVAIGLSSLGIDPDADPRFIKNGTSVLDALLSFALADNSGFGYTNNTAVNAYSTEQGFRALVAASEVAETGKAYNIYDFSANAVSPAYAGGKQSESGSSSGGGSSSDDTITVSFALKTHETTWIKKHNVRLEEDSTVADLFYQVLDSRDGFSYMDSSGYISSITYDGETWAEFDAGENSGWKYMVNGEAPTVGMQDRYLEDGDAVVWYYVADYTADSTPNEGSGTEKAETPAVTGQELAFTDIEGHWAYDAIRYVYEHGLMNGTSETIFAPDLTTSRGMITAILYRLDGSPTVSGPLSFTDVAEEDYCADAVKWAAANGIASGYGDGRFGPKDHITRQQLAVMLHRYAAFKGYDVTAEADLSGFTDAEQIGAWSRDALEWAHVKGLINGRENSTLDPGGNATRGQIAAILTRWLENDVK